MRKLFIVLAMTVVILGCATATSSAAVVPQGVCSAPTLDYPPTPPVLDADLRVLRLDLVPGTRSGQVVLSGAEPGAAYSGTLFSTAIPLPRTVASPGGVLGFTGLAVPGDFELSVLHHLDVVGPCGRAGSYEVCVTSAGELGGVGRCDRSTPVTASDQAGSLARTGQDHLLDLVRAACLVLGIGAFVLYLRRRSAAAGTTS